MPKKQAVQKPPTVITITLPDEGGAVRCGTILIQRGTLAVIRQFEYSDLEGISHAIQDAAIHLIDVEDNPPPDLPEKPAVQTTMPTSDTNEVIAEDETDTVESDLAEPVDNDTDPATAVPSDDGKPINLNLF